MKRWLTQLALRRRSDDLGRLPLWEATRKDLAVVVAVNFD